MLSASLNKTFPSFLPVLEWPGNSPDRNLIENLWTIMKHKLANKQPSTAEKRSVVGSILFSGPSYSLGYFPFQPVVHNWFIKGRGMYCSVYGKLHIKDPLLLIEKSSLCGGSGFPS